MATQKEPKTKYRYHKGCEAWHKTGHSCEDCLYADSCVELKPEKGD